jgi:hypothetical protein
MTTKIDWSDAKEIINKLDKEQLEIFMNSFKAMTFQEGVNEGFRLGVEAGKQLEHQYLLENPSEIDILKNDAVLYEIQLRQQRGN